MGVFNNRGAFVVDMVNFEGFCIIDNVPGNIVNGGGVELDIEDRGWRDGEISHNRESGGKAKQKEEDGNWK